MANTFKNAALKDVSNTSYDTLYTAPGATTTVILAVSLANKTGNAVDTYVQFSDSSTANTHQVLNSVSIPGKTTLEILAGQKYILETGDAIKIKAGSASAIDVVAGVMEIT